MTETSPISTLISLDDALDLRVSTVGRVQPHLEISVRDPLTGRIVRAASPAGLHAATASCAATGTRGGDQAATRGWMHSGDLAVMEESGYVNIVGRLKDMIIRGGEKISPRKIEEVLLAHADVSEVQVIGVPSRKYGEEVMAWIRPRPGASPSDKELTVYCRNRLAAFMVPRYWQLVETSP